jgi:hypothetical protein
MNAPDRWSFFGVRVGWVDKPSISAAHAGFPLKLQPSLRVLRETRQVKSAMLKANENQFLLAMLCRMASVSRSGSPLETPAAFR